MDLDSFLRGQRLRDLEALRSSGETNEELESYIEETLENWEEVRIPSEEESPLEIVDDDLSRSKDGYDEKIFYLDKQFFVCSAEPGPGNEDRGWDNGLKAHEVRNIGVYHEKSVVPPPREMKTSFGDYTLPEILTKITAEQVEDGYVVLYGSMSSVENHFHLVASDLEIEANAKSDLEDISSYFLYRVDDSETNFEEGRVSDNFGIYMHEILQEDEERIKFRNA